MKAAVATSGPLSFLRVEGRERADFKRRPKGRAPWIEHGPFFLRLLEAYSDRARVSVPGPADYWMVMVVEALVFVPLSSCVCGPPLSFTLTVATHGPTQVSCGIG